MPKLGVFSGADICGLLRKYGFVHIHTTGSHALMRTQTARGKITVPVPLHHELAKGTLLSIIKQSQLPRAYFEK